MKFQVLTMLLLGGIFMFGGIAGAFVYASGNRALETVKAEMVSHTEYRYNESGQIVVRLVDFQGNPVAVTNCTASILYPNKTFLVNAALMSDTGNIAGDHYYNFTTPNGPDGVYEYQAECYYAPNKNASATNSFHLSSSFSDIQANLTQMESNLSLIISDQDAMNMTLVSINGTVDAMSLELDNVNTTSNNIYTYLTTTLAASINSVLGIVTQINATVNDINATTNQILQNQQDQVQMSTFSG